MISSGAGEGGVSDPGAGDWRVPLRVGEGHPPPMKNRENGDKLSDVTPHEMTVWRLQTGRGVGGGYG